MPDSAVTLYVKWTTNPTYSIIYHEGSSTGGTVPETVNADSGMQVAIADSGSLYKTGYSFVGWNTKEDGSGKAYKTGDRFVMGTVDIDLYAQWTKAQYTVTYHGNGNTGGTVPPKTTHLYDTEVEIEEPGTIEKTGHTFFKWNTDSAGNGLDYEAGNKITVEKDVHLYARWLKKKYRITFHGNGDRTSNVPDVTEYEYGLKIDSTTVVPSRESYTFNGWFRDSSCTDNWKYVTDSIVSADTLYAKWIIVDADGNIYTEVKIGNQIWMVENLKTMRYNDGTRISESQSWSAEIPACCWYDNNEELYKNRYGALYNWHVVDPTNPHQVAPVGWHVPTDSEWDTLLNCLITKRYESVAKAMAAKDGWALSENANAIGTTPAANNKTGFSAYGGGMLWNPAFFGLDSTGYWWSSTPNPTRSRSGRYEYANFRFLVYDGASFLGNTGGRDFGISVRLLRD